MMSSCKRTALTPRQSSYNSLYVNPLMDPKHNRSYSEGVVCGLPSKNDNSEPNQLPSNEDKENAEPNSSNNNSDKENLLADGSCSAAKPLKLNLNKSFSAGCGGGGGVLKPSSLQFCMQMNEPEKELFGGSKVWDPPSVKSDNSSSLKIWDYSDSEAAPASSWSTLPNK